jgi:hypothetical protein
MQFPNLIRIRQHFPRPRVENLERTLEAELAASGVAVPPGARIAIAVGSRGIANLARLVKTVVSWVKAQGGEPFLVPAMGSHGGATAEGQREVLEGYGVTEAAMGAPIRSSMEVVELPAGELPTPLFHDRHAFEADGTIIINRIKPHTDYHGRYESGLMKMLVIGLGKHRQALAMHSLGVYGLREVIPQAARQVLRHGNVLLGVGLVENAYDETQLVRALPAQDIPDCEPELLELARAAMPRLPVEALDVLVIDRFGKDISGVGLDTSIIGRLMIDGEPEPVGPRLKLIVVCDLTDASHGNACGLGLADLMVRRAYDKIDFAATYGNIFTSGFLLRGKTPIVVDTDRDALTYALRGAGVTDPARARVARIVDTLQLGELLVSPAVLEETAHREDIEVVGPAGDVFDGNGALCPFGAGALLPEM